MIVLLLLIALQTQPTDPVELQFLEAIYQCAKVSNEVHSESIYLFLKKEESTYVLKKSVSSQDSTRSAIDINKTLECFNEKVLNLQPTTISMVINIRNGDKVSQAKSNEDIQTFLITHNISLVDYDLFIVTMNTIECGFPTLPAPEYTRKLPVLMVKPLIHKNE